MAVNKSDHFGVRACGALHLGRRDRPSRCHARGDGYHRRHRRSRGSPKGLENKKESTQVLESIVAEDIGKLPDNNVVEALQRVTGVQVTNRGGGEADVITIRGLPDIETTWNGRNVFTV